MRKKTKRFVTRNALFNPKCNDYFLFFLGSIQFPKPEKVQVGLKVIGFYVLHLSS